MLAQAGALGALLSLIGTGKKVEDQDSECLKVRVGDLSARPHLSAKCPYSSLTFAFARRTLRWRFRSCQARRHQSALHVGS